MKSLPNLLLLISICFHFNLKAQTQGADAITGIWLTASGKAQVKITQSGNYFYGRVVWLKEPMDADNKIKVDKKNPDQSKRSTPIMGIKLLSGFEYTGNHTWEDGTIYDPENGKTYQCKITQEQPNILSIRGFIGFSVIGRTEQWKRVN
jgi:uncharacterized protein (DUF2147 family)